VGALYIATAHALRNAKCVEAAKSVLLSGEQILKTEPLSHYHLAIHECLLGNLDKAKERLKHVFELDEGFRLKALDDPEFKAFWEALQ